MSTLHSHLAHPKYRPDIDGLRAIAILSVVAFHAFPSLVRGGFIGVDVFFVISGYLISTIIFESLDRGTFTFAEFYARRIKRIFPALLLVLIASYTFGWFALLADEYKQLGLHISAGAGFVSNFVLWNETGYFDNSADTKPLLHLWSLGIEEQFYIIWPLLLWLAWKGRFNFLAITLIVAVASFYLNITGIKEDAVAVFYSPQTRFWELLSGSLVAWVILYKKDTITYIKVKLDGWLTFAAYRKKSEVDGQLFSNLLSFVGISLLAYGFWRINKDIGFPGSWAVIPVSGAMLIIFAGPAALVNRIILSNKLAVWFGLISFPLYLWHWPLLSFARIVESEIPSVTIRIAAVVLSVVLAWLTYKLVERPIRLGGHSKGKVSVLVVLMIAVGGVGYITYKKEGLSFRLEEYIENTAQFTMPELKANRDLCKSFIGVYKGHCIASLNAQSIDSLNILFVGDSHGEALSIGLTSEDFTDKFMSLGVGGCLPLVGVERFTENGPFNCETYMGPAFEIIRNHDFKNATLVIVARYSAYVEGTGYGYADTINRAPGNLHIQKIGPKVDAYDGFHEQVFFDGFVETLKFVSGKFKKVIVVQQIPELGFDPKICVSRPLRLNSPACTLQKSDVVARQSSYRDALKRAANMFPDTIVYDPLDIFCDATHCFAMREGKMLYRDDDHMSVLGANAVIQDMRAKGLL